MATTDRPSGIMHARAHESAGSPVLIHLASRSPRRRLLLEQAGLPFRVIDAPIDDSELDPGDSDPVSWVMSLAHLKARAGFQARPPESGVVLGADTVCVAGRSAIGKPASAPEARAMIRSFVGRTHDVVTGVCLIGRHATDRQVFAVRARVSLGELPEDRIESYIESGEWADKAGGYNYFDRRDDGWPLTCTGDETAVVGLPMRELTRRLAAIRSP